MVQGILNAMFGCSHQRTTFPMTAGRKKAVSRTYVVCLDCGKEFAYNWADMRIGELVPARVRAAEAQPSYR
jgi:predicted transcriptional regulator